MSGRDRSERSLHVRHVWLEGGRWLSPCQLLPPHLLLCCPHCGIISFLPHPLCPLLFLLLIIIALGEVDLPLDASGEAVALNGLGSEISGEFKEGDLIDGGFGEGVLEAIIEIAHVVQVAQ